MTTKNHGLSFNKSELPQKFEYKKNIVVLVKLSNYDSKNVEKALTKALHLLEIDDFFQDKTILLKPNALAPTKNAYTPPEIVNGLLNILKAKTPVEKLIVGDSSMTKGLTNLTLNRSNINKICSPLCSKVINFFESERCKISLNNPVFETEKDIYLPVEVVKSDLIINLPKLKTHNGYIYTGAIKNLFGLLGNKMHMHMVHKNKLDFQKMLGDIYFGVEETNQTNLPKVLTIMDAVIAMEGNGPRAGKPRKVGLLIAGFNSAAVDIVGYALMNGRPEHLEAITSVAKRTNLPVDINALDIKGENVKDFIIKDFKKPPLATLKQRELQDKFSKIANKIMSISIKVNKRKCILCQQCVKHCPSEAMDLKNNRIVIDNDACVECFSCGEICPNDAISSKWYLFRVLPYLFLILVLVGTSIFYAVWHFM